MQPDGWIVPGLDANFYAVTAPHVVNGTLLGQPASVRFTPVAFHWDYGDGNAATRSTKGATWEALGIPEFEPTPTSHVYATRGRVHDPAHDRLRAPSTDSRAVRTIRSPA